MVRSVGGQLISTTCDQDPCSVSMTAHNTHPRPCTTLALVHAPDLPKVFRTVHKTQNLPIGDFPTDLNAFGSKLRELNFTKFSKIKQKQLDLGKKIK